MSSIIYRPGLLAGTFLLFTLLSNQGFAADSVGSVLMGQGGKPAKVSWSPSRVTEVDGGGSGVAGSTITVDVTTDKELLDADIRFSGSLRSYVEVVQPPTPITIPAGGTVTVVFQLIEGPDEAGKTLGGTAHLREAGKNLARPLSFSLKQTEEDDEDGGDEEGSSEEEETELVDEDGDLPLEWSVERLTSDLFVGGVVDVTFVSDRDLENVYLWPTPSLRSCLAIELAPGFAPAPEQAIVNPDGSFAFLAAGTVVPLVISLPAGETELGEDCEGTIHLRQDGPNRRTYPAVLEVGDEDEEEVEEVAPAAVVDGASFEEAAIAPGQIVSLFGEGFGPKNLQVFKVEEDGSIGDELGGVMVLFDGFPAPVLSAIQGQINLITPTQLSGASSELLVIQNGKASTHFPVALRPASPGVFTLDGTGRGQAAAINNDGQLNSDREPARGGTTATLFGSGAGPTDPPLPAGAVATQALKLAAEEVRIFVGGVEADVLYAGTAPGLAAAVVQYNIRINGRTPPGPQPVVIVIDGIESGDSATIAVE